jgi:DNA primase small subunit
MTHREFAFITFYGRGMYRHIQFRTPDDLFRYLRKNAPAHSYHSSSYYDFPNANMSQKGWQGADLVFDIDADHFNLPCKKIHDRWKCRNCSKEGTGHTPEICTCGKANFQTESWICSECLQAAKYETQKLIDILIQDMGFTRYDLTTNFSGNRGYHVHVNNSKIKKLDQQARREIVDYILAIGLDLNYQGFNNGYKSTRSIIAETGWRGRIGRALFDYITDCDLQEIKFLKIGRKATKNIIDKKEEILEILLHQHPSNLLSLIDSKNLKILIDEAIKLQASKIDTVVTTDIHRLIRLPNTLHGKTGWRVQTIPYGTLADFDPLVSAISIKGSPVKLRFKLAPKIKINNEEYGPYEEEEAILPLEAAIFFLCRKGAMIIK